MMRILRVVVYVVLMIVLPVTVFFGLPTGVPYSVSEQYTFTSNGQPGTEVSLTVMLPRSGPYQAVNAAEVEWVGTEERIESQSAVVVRLTGKTGSDGKAKAVVSYSVALKQGTLRWTSPAAAGDLSPRKEIESDAPEIVERANELTGRSTRETVYRIFSFTAAFLSWPTGTRVGGDQSALAAYHTRVGGCGEFANLMTALARAADIPARSISGRLFPFGLPPFVSQTAVWGNPAGAHAWVEIFDGSTWAFDDPSLASKIPWKELLFGRTLGMHLSYGEKGEFADVYSDMTAWGESRGEVVGAMSAPVTFVASAPDKTVTVEPAVTVRKGWDARWIGAVALYAATLAGASMIEWKLRQRQAKITRA